MLDEEALIRKHRGKGVLLDTNLFVLFMVGLVNRNRIATFKRTSAFTSRDFDLLTSLIEHFGRPLVTTPHILSQVSDLCDLAGIEHSLGTAELRKMILKTTEIYDPSHDLITDPLFSRLGLADTAITAAALRGTLVLTADLELHVALQHRSLESVNFRRVPSRAKK